MAVASTVGRGLRTTAKIAGGALLAAHVVSTLGKLAWGLHEGTPMGAHMAPRVRESYEYYE